MVNTILLAHINRSVTNTAQNSLPVLLYESASRQALEITHPPTQWVPNFIPGGKATGA